MNNFSIITLNCFGVPTMRTSRRLLTLALELNRLSAKVVSLQEVQTHRYRRLLTRASVGYPAHNYVPFVHAPKGGLLTMAALPIEAAHFTLYRNRGLWYTPALADWILHKGVLQTEMLLEGQRIVVLNTHLTANYRGLWTRDNAFAKQEQLQLKQLAEIVNAQSSDTLVIVTGDFNIPRESWLYDEFMTASGLTDPMAGDTQPTLRPRMGMPQRYSMAIDYALYRAPASMVNVQAESRLLFNEKILIKDYYDHLSDHLGVELKLSWDKSVSLNSDTGV